MILTTKSKLIIGIAVMVTVAIAFASFYLTKAPRTVSLPREQVIPLDAHAIGNREAPVYLVEFSDFQCPQCGLFHPMVKKLISEHASDLFYIYRHYPMPQHKYAMPAALAAEAAGNQGKFWDAVTYLFSHQDTLESTLDSKFIKDMSLQEHVYATDIASRDTKARITKDIVDAQSSNVMEAPTFFLNGVKLTDVHTPEDLSKVVKQTILSFK